MAHVFGHMGVKPAHAGIIRGAWPEGGADGQKRVHPTGPSPVVIHRDDLETVGWLGLGLAPTLTTDPDPPDPDHDPDPILNPAPILTLAPTTHLDPTLTLTLTLTPR